MSLKEKLLILIFGLVFFISAVIRFEQTKNGQFPFTYDQARDMLDIRALGEFKDLWVMGPTTSINGLRLGPFYYYLMLPVYWFGGGDPQALVNWNIILFLISGLAIFLYFRKRDIVLGTTIATIYLMAPRLFDTTRYFWNAHSATIISVYFYLALWNFIEKKDKKAVFWLGLTASVLLQFEAAFGIIALIFSGLIILINSKFKYSKEFLLGVVPWFLPQVAVEIKNKFQMTKLLIGMFSGSNQVLGEKMKIGEVLISHLTSFSKIMEGQFILPYKFGLYLLTGIILTTILVKQKSKILKYLLSFIVFAFVFYSLIYHHELKEWYLDSLRVWYIFVIGITWKKLSNKRIWGVLLFGLFLLKSFYLTINDQKQFMGKINNDNPKNLANLEKNIDWIYQKQQGNKFMAFSFVPEIYDYPQQYLYWWYAQKKYGYRPERYSYSLERVPNYVKAKNDFDQDKESKNIALSYEDNHQSMAWLEQFKDYCLLEKEVKEWKTTLEIREKCL